MEKRRIYLWFSLALAACLVTACGKTPAAAEPAEMTENTQSTQDELSAAEGQSVPGEEKPVPEEGPAHSEESVPEIAESVAENTEAAAEIAEPAAENTEVIAENTAVTLGDEQFEEYLPLLEGKRVALFTNQTGIDLSYLVDAYHAVTETSPGRSFWGSADGDGQYWIDKLSGSSELRQMIEDGAAPGEIKDSWQEDIETFKEQRRPYLLYEE